MTSRTHAAATAEFEQTLSTAETLNTIWSEPAFAAGTRTFGELSP
jgi:hypothetical protein